MKKVLLFIIFLFIPFLVNAVEIKSSFIPEEIKIDEYYEGISKGDDEGYVIVGSLANDTLIKKYTTQVFLLHRYLKQIVNLKTLFSHILKITVK